MKVAVTGASGFVGGAVCRALTDQGFEVDAYGRRGKVPPEHVGGAAYRSWDIAAPAPASVTARRTVDAVIHCAGTVSDWGPIEQFFAANVDGTRHVMDAFPDARFVHVSTASVYDPHVPTVMATEDRAPVGRYVNGYGASKAAAERLVLRSMAERDAIILRPHAIYGPGDTTLMPRVLSAVRGPLLLGVGTGRQLVSLTSIGNLVQACLLAASGPIQSGVFNVTDAEPLVLDDAMRWVLAERGIKARTAYLPERAVHPLAAAVEGVHLLVGSAKPPRLTRYVLGHLAVERTLDITAACTRLGYAPTKTSFDGAASW
jgi:nucleoside-diphosphate-sugar epimerase